MSKVVDERIVSLKQRISSEAFLLLLLFLLASMLYKQIILKAEFITYVIEFIGFFGSLLYVSLRNLFSGTLIEGEVKKKRLAILSIIYGIISVAFFAVASFTQKTVDYKWFMMISIFFVVSVCSYFFIIKGMERLNIKRLEQIDKQQDDDE